MTIGLLLHNVRDPVHMIRVDCATFKTPMDVHSAVSTLMRDHDVTVYCNGIVVDTHTTESSLQEGAIWGYSAVPTATDPSPEVTGATTGFYTLTVRTLAGRSLPIGLPEGATVADLKWAIAAREGTKPSQQRLIFAGKLLDSAHTLDHYNIQSGATLHLVLHLRGGLGAPHADLKSDALTLSTSYDCEDSVPGEDVGEGLTIEGVCPNTECKALGRRVGFYQHKDTFQLGRDVTDCVCPLCRCPMRPLVVGVLGSTMEVSVFTPGTSVSPPSCTVYPPVVGTDDIYSRFPLSRLGVVPKGAVVRCYCTKCRYDKRELTCLWCAQSVEGEGENKSAEGWCCCDRHREMVHARCYKQMIPSTTSGNIGGQCKVCALCVSVCGGESASVFYQEEDAEEADVIGQGGLPPQTGAIDQESVGVGMMVKQPVC
ncbi:ubiquitin [Kipferlia bialata]|uniref:Ubiquitin n=1 Tax=Kipferlia bialata TaxID=797122 RepID=A0A9K3CMX6_9EUKA|nr:ubiquitin [Kipferlia bialata]|eukprot:g13.t1